MGKDRQGCEYGCYDCAGDRVRREGVDGKSGFGTPSVELATEGEKQWGFGQLLTMLLLILPFVTALEVFRGEFSGAQPVRVGSILTGDFRRDSGPQSESWTGFGSRTFDRWKRCASGRALHSITRMDKYSYRCLFTGVSRLPFFEEFIT